MNCFIDCNFHLRDWGFLSSDTVINEEVFIKRLEQSKKSGLIVDRERGLFIRK